MTAEFVERAAPSPSRQSRRAPCGTGEHERGRRRRPAVRVHRRSEHARSRTARGASRRAAAPFFSRLTFADRSALMLMPLGPNVSFTWAHDRVREGLQRVTGMGRQRLGWEYGSLADARDIANRNQMVAAHPRRAGVRRSFRPPRPSVEGPRRPAPVWHPRRQGPGVPAAGRRPAVTAAAARLLRPALLRQEEVVAEEAAVVVAAGAGVARAAAGRAASARTRARATSRCRPRPPGARRK